MSASEEPTLAEFLARTLPSHAVTHVFELVGGMITILLDAMHRNPELTVVSMHHEQGAGFAAEGFARTAGRPAVALATSGPGATNLLTAIGSCYFDSVPVVFITGQVNTYEIHTPGQGRQGGFQETDIVSMAKPVTKHARLVEDASDFADVLAEAFAIATSGRPGPVLLDIPMNVQRSVVRVPPAPVAAPDPAQVAGLGDFVDELLAALSSAQRPLVLAGGGIRAAGADAAFADFVHRMQVPVVTSLMGTDSLSSDSPMRVGFMGSYGNRWANWAVAQSDLLIVLGSRLDVRQTGSDIAGFRGERRIFHVDVDAGELNHHVKGCNVLRADLVSFFQATQGLGPMSGWPIWFEAIEEQRREWPADSENVPEKGINPNSAVAYMSQAWSDTHAFVTDVGQHQMWAAQSVVLKQGQRFLTSGGMGSMGFGLPAAIGAALARPDQPVTLWAGDGGFQCNIQELQTAVRLGLRLRIVVFDNRAHGMVRQFQESYFDGRYHSTVWGYDAPDFARVAEAYGVPSWRACDEQSLAQACSEMAEASGPCLLHLDVEQSLNAYPKMAFGRPFGSMEPEAQPLEMEGT